MSTGYRFYSGFHENIPTLLEVEVIHPGSQRLVEMGYYKVISVGQVFFGEAFRPFIHISKERLFPTFEAARLNLVTKITEEIAILERKYNQLVQTRDQAKNMEGE